LGLGEGGGFPGSAKAVSEWFPPKERSFAFGIFNTGSSVGAVIAPPLIAAIVLLLGWRWVFFITGGLGIVWAFAWLRLYRLPAEHKYITPAERELIETSLEQAAVVGRDGERPPSFCRIRHGTSSSFGCPNIWGMSGT
jgi:ACS family hexuronate transporter-like MFS transporter